MTTALCATVREEHLIPVLGQQIRARVRAGTGVPLVLCNGIGASLEVLDPLVEHLNPDTTVVRFDVPGARRFTRFAPALWLSVSGCGAATASRQAGLARACRRARAVMGRRAGTAVRLPKPPPLPAADPGSHRHGHHDGAGPADRARENAHPTAIPGSRLRRVNRR